MARNSKFRGQLRIKLKKFGTKDLFAKSMWIQDPNQLKIGVKLKKLEVWKSIKDEIEKKIKTREQDENGTKVRGSF
jgi:hypothetical protein